MPMTSWFGCRGLAAGLALAVYTPAAAEFGSIGYPPQAVYPFGAASVSSVISIPNSDPGIHGFLLNLILPQDYKADAKVRIVVYLTTSVAKPCNMVFEPELLTRWRPGVAPGMFSTGIAPANGSNLVAFPNNKQGGGEGLHDRARSGLSRRTASRRCPQDWPWPGRGEPVGHLQGIVQVPAIDIRYPRVP